MTIDFETKSYADLKQVGSWTYSEHPSTEIICLCWHVRHANGASPPIGEWVPGPQEHGPDNSCPPELEWAIRHGYEIEGHNVAFEMGMWMNGAVPKFGWPEIRPEQWRDSMATACYYALPAALDALCRALKFPGKDPEGSRLISKYSKLHLKTAKSEIPPEDLRKFIDYCRKDVELEERVSDYLGDLPERELPIYQLDTKINLRGLYLDAEGIAAATAIVDKRSEELTTRFRALTGLNPTQTVKLMEWFAGEGVALENMQADYLEELLEEATIPAGAAREAMQIRLKINKASTKKLDAMSRNRDTKGRARFQARYHGAQTGRDTGAGFQPLNLVRSWEDVDADDLVRDVMYGDPEWLDLVYGDAMEAVSKAGRHWIMAEPGNRILAGDFNSIEAVILAALAGETWKVQAFRDKVKIYELMGDKIHGLPPGTVNKKTHPAERQDGKTGELAFGYQGALGAWLKFDSSGRHTDERIIEICKAWRAEHPMTVALWAGLEKASIEAVQTGQRTEYRGIGFEIIDEWLSMILPNAKRIWYREPELRMGMPKWHKPETEAACAEGSCRCKPRAHLTYMAQKEGQWKRVATYGGKLTENAVQAKAREYLRPSVKAVEDAGYPVILKVYDEVVCEVPDGHGSEEEFARLLKDAPRPWAVCDDGQPWPIGVDTFQARRYRK